MHCSNRGGWSWSILPSIRPSFLPFCPQRQRRFDSTFPNFETTDFHNFFPFSICRWVAPPSTGQQHPPPPPPSGGRKIFGGERGPTHAHYKAFENSTAADALRHRSGAIEIRGFLFNAEGKYRNCTGPEFRCNNSRCISVTMKCDGNNDCIDNSDETNCG